jgi:O-antigen ligase
VKVSYGLANSTVLALLPTLFVAAILASVVLMSVQGKHRFQWSILDVLVISFFTLDFMQIFNPYLRAFEGQEFLIIGLRGFHQRSFLGFVYFAVRSLDMTSLRVNTLMRIFTYSIALGGLYAITQQLYKVDMFESAYQLAQIETDPLLQEQFRLRAVGFLGSPYTFGLVSAMGLVCGAYLFHTVARTNSESLLSLTCVIINAIAVLVSGSRSSYISLAGVLFILIFIMHTPIARVAWAARRKLVAAIVCLVLFFIAFPDSDPVTFAIDRVSSLHEIISSNDSLNDNNFRIRRELNAAAWPMILANPLGYGSGIFNGGSNPNGLIEVQGYSSFMDNEFIGLALELGILGVAIFLAILGTALYRCRLALRLLSCRGLARTLAALVVICPTAGIGGQWLAAYPANVIFWVVLGLVAALPVNRDSGQHFVRHG